MIMCHTYSYAFLGCMEGLELKVKLSLDTANRLLSGFSPAIQMMTLAERLLLLF